MNKFKDFLRKFNVRKVALVFTMLVFLALYVCYLIGFDIIAVSVLLVFFLTIAIAILRFVYGACLDILEWFLTKDDKKKL